MNGYKVIVDKSTVPVGTAARVRDIIRRETTHPFSVVSNPEFLKQGAAIEDFLKPDRVVIGAEDARAAEIMRELYAPFTRTGRADHGDGLRQRRAVEVRRQRAAGHAHLVHERGRERLRGVRRRTSTRCARPSARIAASARRSCSPASATAAAASRRTSRRILKFAADKGYDFETLKAVESVNQRQKGRLVDEDAGALRRSLKGKTIALWGLAFKPRTDDMREAPAITIVERLLAAGRQGAGVRSGGDAASHAACSGRRSIWPTRATTR